MTRQVTACLWVGLSVLIGTSAQADVGRSFAPQRTVVIGDSQAEGLRKGSTLAKMGVLIFDHRGKTAGFFREWLAKNPQAVANKDLIVLQMGGNDIAKGTETEALQRDILAVVKLARSLNPQAQIVVAAIPVRGEWFDARRTRNFGLALVQEQIFKQVNAWIAQGGNGAFSYFASNAVIADPANPRLQRAEFRRVGKADVHLNKSGYRALGGALTKNFLSVR